MKQRIQLDWSRLLGFDQVAAQRRLEESGLAKSGIKQSIDGTSRITSKVSVKPVSPGLGHRISAKIGSKPGIKT